MQKLSFPPLSILPFISIIILSSTLACSKKEQQSSADTQQQQVASEEIAQQAQTQEPAMEEAGSLREQIKRKIAQIEAEQVNFPDRADEIESMNDYIQNGDFEMAIFKADQIIEKQQNLSSSKGKLPPQLQQKIAQIKAGRVDYPDRADEIESMNDYIQNGDFEMAIFKADEIIKKQNNLR